MAKPYHRVSDSTDPEGGPRMCISYKFTCDVDVVSGGPHFENYWYRENWDEGRAGNCLRRDGDRDLEKYNWLTSQPQTFLLKIMMWHFVCLH